MSCCFGARASSASSWATRSELLKHHKHKSCVNRADLCSPVQLFYQNHFDRAASILFRKCTDGMNSECAVCINELQKNSKPQITNNLSPFLHRHWLTEGRPLVWVLCPARLEGQHIGSRVCPRKSELLEMRKSCSLKTSSDLTLFSVCSVACGYWPFHLQPLHATALRPLLGLLYNSRRFHLSSQHNQRSKWMAWSAFFLNSSTEKCIAIAVIRQNCTQYDGKYEGDDKVTSWWPRPWVQLLVVPLTA